MNRIIIAFIVVAIAIATYYYYYGAGSAAAAAAAAPPPPPSQQFSTPDGVSFAIPYPAGKKVVFNSLSYGPTDGSCPMLDVTQQLQSVLSGDQVILGDPFGANTFTLSIDGMYFFQLLGIPDPCPGVSKVITGSYYFA